MEEENNSEKVVEIVGLFLPALVVIAASLYFSITTPFFSLGEAIMATTISAHGNGAILGPIVVFCSFMAALFLAKKSIAGFALSGGAGLCLWAIHVLLLVDSVKTKGQTISEWITILIFIIYVIVSIILGRLIWFRPYKHPFIPFNERD